MDDTQAFPSVNDYGRVSGMTLRDYFAGQVIIGMFPKMDAELAASIAYKIADLMLKERSKNVLQVSKDDLMKEVWGE